MLRGAWLSFLKLIIKVGSFYTNSRSVCVYVHACACACMRGQTLDKIYEGEGKKMFHGIHYPNLYFL